MKAMLAQAVSQDTQATLRFMDGDMYRICKVSSLVFQHIDAAVGTRAPLHLQVHDGLQVVHEPGSVLDHQRHSRWLHQVVHHGHLGLAL